MSRLPDAYFERMYSSSADPWALDARWYEKRKYAITLALLPRERYRHAFEPGCSIGVLTALLAVRCDRVTATDVADAALEVAGRRLQQAGCREQVTLLRQSIDQPWPRSDFDLVVLSEVGYYLTADALRKALDSECTHWAPGATVVAAHWRHPVADYPMSGDDANQVIADTAGLHRIGRYQDTDVVVDVFDTASDASVAGRTGVPGAGPTPGPDGGHG